MCRIRDGGRPCTTSPVSGTSLCARHTPLICTALTIHGYPCNHWRDRWSPQLALCSHHGGKFTGRVVGGTLRRRDGLPATPVPHTMLVRRAGWL